MHLEIIKMYEIKLEIYPPKGIAQLVLRLELLQEAHDSIPGTRTV